MAITYVSSLGVHDQVGFQDGGHSSRSNLKATLDADGISVPQALGPGQT